MLNFWQHINFSDHSLLYIKRLKINLKNSFTLVPTTWNSYMLYQCMHASFFDKTWKNQFRLHASKHLREQLCNIFLLEIRLFRTIIYWPTCRNEPAIKILLKLFTINQLIPPRNKLWTHIQRLLVDESFTIKQLNSNLFITTSKYSRKFVRKFFEKLCFYIIIENCHGKSFWKSR